MLPSSEGGAREILRTEEKLRGRTKHGIERPLSSKRGRFHDLPEFFPSAGPHKRDLPRRRNKKPTAADFNALQKEKKFSTSTKK